MVVVLCVSFCLCVDSVGLSFRMMMILLVVPVYLWLVFAGFGVGWVFVLLCCVVVFAGGLFCWRRFGVVWYASGDGLVLCFWVGWI